jgi:hypothetical protein
LQRVEQPHARGGGERLHELGDRLGLGCPEWFLGS